MKTYITQRDLENPQRFIAEGLGAPEFEVVRTLDVSKDEVNAQAGAGCIHGLCS